MTVYAVGHFTNVTIGPEILQYRSEIVDTIRPFGGRFLFRAAPSEELEPGWPGDMLVAIEFPDRESANGWFQSEAYQRIIPMRLRNADGWVVLVDGEPQPA